MRIFLFLLLYVCQTALAASLSPIEKDIQKTIIEQKQSQIQLLEKLVNINSGTLNITGVRAVGELLRPQFEELGFTTRWVEEPAEMKRAATFIAERQGNKGKSLLLIGHLDTVFAGDSDFQQFQLHKHSAKGPGVLDNKGGIVVLLYALKALQSVNALNDTSITVVLTGDEEDSGKPTSISRNPLIEIAKHSQIALDFESAITLQTGTIARRGISDWIITTTGNESHSATIFQKEVGVGAIFSLAHILDTMRVKLHKIKYLSFNPGAILGGSNVEYDKKTFTGTAFGKSNVVAKTALARGDLRFIDTKQKKSVEEKIKKIVKQHLPGSKATVTFQDGIPAMPPTKNNLKLLKEYSKVSEDLHYGKIKPLDPGLRGAGDISHVAAYVPENLAGLGPAGSGDHSVTEMVELKSLTIQTERAAILIYRLTHS